MATPRGPRPAVPPRARRRRPVYAGREWLHRRRAAAMGCRVEVVDYAALVRQARRICYLCATYIGPRQLAFDHVIPLCRGGAHSASNIRPTHKVCNLRKGKRLLVTLF